MNNQFKEITYRTLGVILLLASIGVVSAMIRTSEPNVRFEVISKPIAEETDIKVDTTELPWPNTDTNYPTENTDGISLALPDNIQYQVQYDPLTGEYYMIQTIGENYNYRYPSKMTMDEYLKYDFKKNLSEYWKEQQEEQTEENSEFAPKLNIGGDGFENIFGSNEIEIRPQGSAEITFGLNISKTENPRIPVKQQRISTFDFAQKIQLNVVGNIGTKMKLTTNFNTEATFDFENQMKLEYTGDEDEIIKKIEAGNVSLPLSGTLITGSQALFGVKLETQWGKLRNTTVLSQQKGERKEIEVSGGAQTQTYDIKADAYDANRHFFLGQYFRDTYDEALASLPVVNSGVNITRIEVYVVNTQSNSQDVRNVVAFTDLGENSGDISSDLNIADITNGADYSPTPNPSNFNNDIYSDMINDPTVMGYSGAVSVISSMPAGYDQGIHYERVGNARKLTESEFSYNARLGFISLRQSLNNAEVLSVAYEYTLGGETYKVGTLALDGFTPPEALILKMLKSSVTNVKSPMWDLMMKNIYNIGAYGVQKDKFRLEVWYDNPALGVPQNYIDRDPLKNKLLIQVLNMDKLDGNYIAHADGIFDYVDNAATQGGTINSQDGRVFFPVVEPFGEHLASKITDGIANPDEAAAIINSVVFQELYDSTKTAAQQIPAKNRFSIKGQYQSSSGSEISLNALNIPRGSVAVTAGGVKLTEGQDYTVDYNLGRVRIINEGIMQSGTPIKISLESQSLFSFQSKVLLGSRFDYELNKNLRFGATVMNMRERPLTQKVNIGDEPVNNTILGFDMAYQKEAPWITRMVDKIPLIDTKAESKLDFSGEFAYFIPGHSKAIGKDGNAYIDDFEGSQSTIDLRSINQWYLASTPKLQTSRFPEGAFEDSLVFNYNRGLMSWYIIDPTIFFRSSGLTPDNIDEDIRSNHQMREVLESEVFPNKELPPGTPAHIATLDLSFYPEERGQYNYEPFTGSNESFGLNPDGTLINPDSRWGGIQRSLTTTDFEASNIEYIQFWMMDPFNDDSQNITGGELFFNLGNVSEDILNDSQLSYENGYPTTNSDLPILTSVWGNYPDPSNFNVVNAFDNSTGNYDQQDIGIDGLDDVGEQNFFSEWLGGLQGNLTAGAYDEYQSDPSGDNFVYFRGNDADNADLNTLERYKKFNGYHGNSNTDSPEGFNIAATTIPNTEDINQDLTLNAIESYYQYKVDIKPNEMAGPTSVGSNYITDSFEQTLDNLPNGETKTVRWYQFKIPVKEYDERFGNIADFRSIRFMRVFMKGFNEEITLRFARLELIRGEWRRFEGNLATPGPSEPDDPDPTTFNVAAVSLEENAQREPINYIEPPGIVRETDLTTQRNINEQSLSLEVCNLQDGDSRAAYRNINFDMRLYKKLKMFVHAEKGPNGSILNDNDVTCFIRLGTDFTDNYYEYNIPLKVTDDNANSTEEIWPEDNFIEIEFEKLQKLKIARNKLSYPITDVYNTMDGTAEMGIKGNPNLANVVTVMIGIRNPDASDNPFGGDDGLDKCTIVWVNELRLTDFDEKGGWAAVARMNTNLADFGTLQVAGNISKPGWGSLEQSVLDRQRETIIGIDANSTLQLGKFFPEDLGVQIPMYVGFSQTVSTPQYDPLSPDVEISEADLSPGRKKSAQNFVKRRSINFTNVKINPKKKADSKAALGKGSPGASKGKGALGGNKDKKRFYNISNFSVSYGYNETYTRDVNTEFLINKQYTGAFSYAFTNKPKQIKPFSKISFVKQSKYMKWLKDFNFYPGLKQVSFRTQMNRLYETSKIRNNTLELYGFESDALIQTQVMKNWDWTRTYGAKYDLTKAIKIDYSANNRALVGEPFGVIDKTDQDYYELYKDTVWNNIEKFGETTNFDQGLNLSYKLPFDKIPFFDFISSDARYGSTFRWDRAPFSQDSLGHTIQNSRLVSLNAQANFLNLYNKVPYLKDINRNKKKKKKKENKPANDDVDGFGKEKEEEEKKKKGDFSIIEETLRFLMMVKNVSGSYSTNEGMLLPGYGKKTNVLGMDSSFDGPGVGFLLGQQNTDVFGNPAGSYAQDASNNGWIVQNANQNQAHTETYTQTFNLRANIEPIKYFKIEVSANKQTGRNNSSFFRYDDDLDEFVFDSPTEIGNTSISVNTWGTAFIKDDDSFNSAVFDEMLANRQKISERLNSENYQTTSTDIDGYYLGWGENSQDVIAPAFLAAYTGKSASTVKLNPFKSAVQPNWKVTYDGLSRNKKFKKYFKRFSIKHTYQSTMTTSYQTNLGFEGDGEDRPTTTNQDGNFITQKQISAINISESMSPLIGFDMTIKTAKKNEPNVKVELRKDRNVVMSMTNYQITENKSNSLVMGVGYKFKGIKNPFQSKKSKLPVQMLENVDMQVRADITIRDNSTIIRKVVDELNQVTAGQRIISLKTSVDLNVSQKITLRFFYDQQLTRPKISNSFNTSNISTGITLRFTLS